MLSYQLPEFLARSTDTPFEETELGKLLEVLPSLGNGVWLAGGAIRRTLLGLSLDTDLDFFFQSVDHLKQFEKTLGMRRSAATEHVATYKGNLLDKNYKIQAIKIKYFQSPEEILDSFDYTICQFVSDGQNVWVGDYSMWDLARKRLAVHHISYPVASMRRMLKYANQGFQACPGAMAELLKQTIRDPKAQEQLDIEYVD